MMTNLLCSAFFSKFQDNKPIIQILMILGVAWKLQQCEGQLEQEWSGSYDYHLLREEGSHAEFIWVPYFICFTITTINHDLHPRRHQNLHNTHIVPFSIHIYLKVGFKDATKLFKTNLHNHWMLKKRKLS